MAEADATKILLDHIQDVLAAFKDADGNTRASYDILAGSIADVGAMAWNTFRTRSPVVVAAWEAGNSHQSETVRDLEQTIVILQEDLTAARSDMGKIQSQIQADTGETMSGQIQADTIPKTLEGWSINQHHRGYWRAFRKVKGKSRCVYLGSKFDAIAAQQKLIAANAAMAEQEVR